MGGGDLFPEQPWEEVCATITATLDTMTLSGGQSSSELAAAAAVGRRLAWVGKDITVEAWRLRAVLDKVRMTEQSLAAFRVTGPLLAEAAAVVAEAEAALLPPARISWTAARCWPGHRDALQWFLKRAAAHLGAAQATPATEDDVRAEAVATFHRLADSYTFEWRPAHDFLFGFNMRNDEQLAFCMGCIGWLARRAAGLLVDAPTAAS